MDGALRHFENKLLFEIDSSDLHDMLDQKQNVVVIDARKPFAYETEHIPGAINIPHRTMNTETTKSLDKNTLYVTYCDGIGCNASTKGAMNMTKLGFKTKELIGGIQWWKFDGYETHGKKPAKKQTIECAC